MSIKQKFLDSTNRASQIGITLPELVLKGLDAVVNNVDKPFDFKREMAINAGIMFEDVFYQYLLSQGLTVDRQATLELDWLSGHVDFLVDAPANDGKYVIECKSFGNLKPYTKGQTEQENAEKKCRSDNFGYKTQLVLYDMFLSTASTIESYWAVYSRDTGRLLEVKLDLETSEKDVIVKRAMAKSEILNKLSDLLGQPDDFMQLLVKSVKDLGERVTPMSVSEQTGRVYGQASVHFEYPQLFNKGTGKVNSNGFADLLTTKLQQTKNYYDLEQQQTEQQLEQTKQQQLEQAEQQ